MDDKIVLPPDGTDIRIIATVVFDHWPGDFESNHGLGCDLGSGSHVNCTAVAQVLDESVDSTVQAYVYWASVFILNIPTDAEVTMAGYELTGA